MTEDIIEIGNDGSFNIPSPTKQKDKEYKLIEPSEEAIEKILRSVLARDAFDSMSPGEYKIFKDNESLVIFVRIGEEEKPCGTKLVNDNLVIDTTANRSFTVDLPAKLGIKRDSIDVKYLGDMLTAKFSL